MDVLVQSIEERPRKIGARAIFSPFPNLMASENTNELISSSGPLGRIYQDNQRTSMASSLTSLAVPGPSVK